MPLQGLGGLGGVAGVFDGGIANRAYLRAYNDAAQDMVTGGNRDLLLDQERWDVTGLHDVSSNTERMIATIGGIYLLTGHIQWEATLTGNIRRLQFVNDGGTMIAATSEPDLTVAVPMTQSGVTVWEFAQDEWCKGTVWHNRGSNLEILSAAQQSPEMTMHLLAVPSSAVAARVYNNANLSIGNAGWANLTFNSERYDYGGLHSTVSNTERLVAPSDGTYLVTLNVMWENVGTNGVRIIRIRADQSSVDTYFGARSADGEAAEVMSIAAIVRLSAGDFVYPEVYHNRGSAMNVLSGSWSLSPEFTMTKLGDLTLPGASAFRNANQSIGNNSWTVAPLNTEYWDTDGCWEAGNPTRLTCQTAGYYVIVGDARFAAQGSGVRGGGILLNGTTIIGRQHYDAEATFNQACVCTVYYLSVGDYVELQAYTNMGVAQNLEYYLHSSPYLTMARIG